MVNLIGALHNPSSLLNWSTVFIYESFDTLGGLTIHDDYTIRNLKIYGFSI